MPFQFFSSCKFQVLARKNKLNGKNTAFQEI